MRRGDSGIDGGGALRAVLVPAFLRKLDRLHVRVQRSLSTRPGNTAMPRGSQSAGIELERHKAYDPGDDLRHLDWNAYGRLDQLLVKRYRAEREAPLQIFLDVSRSMMTPEGESTRAFALGLAASLAYISLRNHDPVRIVAVGAALPNLQRGSAWFRHRDAIGAVCEFLLGLPFAGETALATGIAAALREQRQPGVAVVVSDFLVDPSAYETALGMLIAQGFTVAAVRVLGPSERDPATVFRRAELLDAETGRRRFISLSPANITAYQRGLDAHLERLRTFCGARGVLFCCAETHAGLEHTIFRQLPAVGLLR